MEGGETPVQTDNESVRMFDAAVATWVERSNDWQHNERLRIIDGMEALRGRMVLRLAPPLGVPIGVYVDFVKNEFERATSDVTVKNFGSEVIIYAKKAPF